MYEAFFFREFNLYKYNYRFAICEKICSNICMFIIRQILALFSVATGFAILFLACSLPVYFTSVDKYVVSEAGKHSKTLKDTATFSLDNSQISTALILAECMSSPDEIKKSAKKLLDENPAWRLSGGDCPFYDTYCSSVEFNKEPFGDVYKSLASRENRKILTEFLSQSKMALVKKMLSLRKLNTVMLPPAYSSAGAPYEASLLTLALLSQSASLNEKFTYELSLLMADISSSASQERFEKCIIGVLALSKNLDFSALSALFKVFKSPDEVFDYAIVYDSQKDAHFRACMYSATIMISDAPLCTSFLNGADVRSWGNLSFALENGEGAVKFLLSNAKVIYENSPAEQLIDAYCAPMKNLFAPYCVNNLKLMLTLKVLLVLIGCSVVASGVLRMIGFRRAGAFFSVRCLLVGVVCSVLFFSAIEPSAFEVKIQNSTASDIKIAFDRIKTNIVGDKDTMSLDTDSATLAAIALFFVIQMIVYIVCLVRINVIKRTRASATLKLKLLENEDNLFDLGLYIGLSGTVASLILLTFGVITASLMAGYTSTLFGILFTALVKIVHLRKFKRKLLIEAANEQH